MRQLILCVVLVVAAPALAQEPPPQGPTFRTGVDVITLDVAALDDGGRPVEGLMAPEFTVRIDGRPRRVVSVEPVRFAPSDRRVRLARRAPVVERVDTFFSSNLTAPDGRLIVIAVDELNIRTGNVRQLLRSAADFVDQLNPEDRVAFYAYPRPGAFVDFTNDHARIRRAMETVVGKNVPFRSRNNIGLYEAVQVQLRQDNLLAERVFARECRGMDELRRDLCEQEVISEMTTMVGEMRLNREASLQGLQELLQWLRVLDGPKSLVLVSEGLVLEDRTDLDTVIRLAAAAQASIHVLLMDVIRGSDVTTSTMPPTMSEDRRMQTEGLQEMAFAARGALHTVIGDGRRAFERLASELSAYYLVAVEAEPGDRDDTTHRIDVEVRRRGVTLRSRRAFVMAAPPGSNSATRMGELLSSPFGVSGVPLRLATFAMQDENPAKVRLLLAADVGHPGTASGKYTVGWTLIDPDGRVAVAGSGDGVLSPIGGRADMPLGFMAPVVVDPGVYSLRFGVVDESGRRGSVVREVNAWKLRGEEFAVADLVVGAALEADRAIVPTVEPHLDGPLAALLELYASTPTLFDRTAVTFEIADGEDTPALLTAPGQLGPARAEPGARGVSAVINPRALPAGRYVVRARITRDGTPVGLLVRPFVLVAPTAAAAAAPIVAPPLPLPRFEATTVLAPTVVEEILGDLDRQLPGLRQATAAARSGRYGAAALEALGAGSQEAAAFFKGLEWYVKGDLQQAANQLNIAAGPRRSFFPAAFYLGAVFAAAGRDRDAAGVWQLGMGAEQRPAIVYAMFADARFRDGQPQSVVDVLQPAWQRTPGDDQLARRLAVAYVLTGKHAEALPVLDGYLARNPGDQDALLAAIIAQYEAATRAGVSLSDVERTRLARWARAYAGPQRALVEKYLTVLR